MVLCDFVWNAEVPTRPSGLHRRRRRPVEELEAEAFVERRKAREEDGLADDMAGLTDATADAAAEVAKGD